MRFSTAFALLAATSTVLAAPVPALEDRDLIARATVFPPTTYAKAQISSGTGGNAQAKAEAVCVTPFAGASLASVDAASLTNLSIFRKAAEDAETDFNDAISAAGAKTAAGLALNVGKIQNKVLKLTCLAQVNKIKQAQGSSSAAAAITDAETKLKKNIATDVANKGKASTGLANSPAAAASEKAKAT
ncbi:hypothetical protein GALMADRAFT_137150 [Galerina marginata CBS 339.88]|uniref:Small secreted protein n=1 Tax=Galerina marginata (strain CBS 339.88) TaxID=685588 RepID=A0A067T817_GALM3|nr:hypothetical protein GALMADRAFT_137150 [Galerina marginata CBS 339.88]